MSKSAVLGNGKLLIGLDKFGQVKDAYFHYPGLENHVSENLVHKIGVFVNDRINWLDEPTWQIKVETAADTMATIITADSAELGLKLVFSDVVYNEKNIFIRELSLENLFDS